MLTIFLIWLIPLTVSILLKYFYWLLIYSKKLLNTGLLKGKVHEFYLFNFLLFILDFSHNQICKERHIQIASNCLMNAINLN